MACRPACRAKSERWTLTSRYLTNCAFQNKDENILGSPSHVLKLLTKTTQKMFSLSGNFQGCPENFQKHSRLSEKFPYCLETFYLPANLAPADIRQCSEAGILRFYQANCWPYSTLLLFLGKLLFLKD